MSTNTWTDAGAAMARANELLTLKEIKEISNVPSYEIVTTQGKALATSALYLKMTSHN